MRLSVISAGAVRNFLHHVKLKHFNAQASLPHDVTKATYAAICLCVFLWTDGVLRIIRQHDLRLQRWLWLFVCFIQNFDGNKKHCFNI